ncbi:HEXXH motif-containing putative peptide modification protein [Actinoplanes sp. NBC_00393]|uniref:aKG-HExxH-type peptide beta-hydroxylase n=1 Tax=Actinoplanes sp. NBC_00393 TaxID=2975953 RepID=UPI002E1E70E3
MREYVLTDEQYRSLAEGGGSPDAVGLLTEAQLSHRRLCLLAVAEKRDSLPVAVQDALALVMEIERASRAAVLNLLRYPFLDAWFASLASALAGGSPDEQVLTRAGAHLGALATGAAIAAGAAFETVLVCTGSDLLLPAVGTAIGIGPAEVPVRCDGATVLIGGSLELSLPCAEPVPGWRPARHVPVPGHVLEIIDADPWRDRFPVSPLGPLSGPDAARLDCLVRDAWQLLDAEQPAHTAGMRIALRGLVPMQTPPGAAQVSASVRGCFGAIGLSVADDAQTLAEILVHEFQHEKLGALLDLVDLCAEGGRARHHAPWRPDPRPAEALMQGIYAFSGVAGFWRARRGQSADADFRYFTWRDHVVYALAQLLRSGELTPEGRRFFRVLEATLAAWRDEAPTPAAIRLGTAAAHLSWRLAHHRPQPADVSGLAAAWCAAVPPPAAGPPVVRDGTVPALLAGLLEEQAYRGRAERADVTRAEQAVLHGDPAAALRVLPAPGDDRDWTAAAVALYAQEGERAVAYRRPDLLRAVFQHLDRDGRRPGLTALHAWLTDVPDVGTEITG